MKINDQLLLRLVEEAPLQVGAEVVGPAEAAALPAAAKAGQFGDGPPTALAIGEDEVNELLVFLGRPRALLHPELVTTRLPTHQ